MFFGEISTGDELHAESRNEIMLDEKRRHVQFFFRAHALGAHEEVVITLFPGKIRDCRNVGNPSYGRKLILEEGKFLLHLLIANGDNEQMRFVESQAFALNEMQL